MELSLRRLQMLRELHRRGTVTAAAQALHYSPSGVSQQLAQLEREVGVKLIEKTGRRVQLTELGLLLSEHAEEILGSVERATAAIESAQEGITARLTAGVWASVASGLLPRTLSVLHAAHPGIAVSANAAIEHSDVQGGYAGAGNISADPLFFDAAAYDYGIGDGSPCIDTGVYAGIETDCLGVSRPQLSTYDMGAYEYVPEPQAAWLLACLVFTAVCGRAGRRRAPP